MTERSRSIGIQTLNHIEWILPVLLLGVSTYYAISLSPWFATACALLLAETLVYLLLLSGEKRIKIAALIQFFHSPAAMIALLSQVFLGQTGPHYLPWIIVCSCCTLIKAGVTLFYYLDAKKRGDALSYAKALNATVSLLYMANLLLALVLKQIVTDENVGICILIALLSNAVSTFAVSYFSTAFLVTASAKAILPFKEKIRTVSRFFIRYNLAFIFSQAFSLVATTICLLHMVSTIFYLFLAFFYSLFFVARLITFIWNRNLERESLEPEVLSKKKHGVLMFNSIFFFAAGNLVAIASLMLSNLRLLSSIPAWFFVGFMFPFSVLSLVMCLVHRKSAKRIDNAYLDVTADQSLVASSVGLLAGLSYFLRYLPNEQIAGVIWLILWLSLMGLLTAALVYSFVRSIIGLRGKRKNQVRQEEETINCSPES